ncbi:MAG TPA: ABC transporter ATP-binding protein [Candidatus Baltobacteraceae bacterium]|nr:ABC transporter ATP-binding protein [Candidatus Baltobacteraceae bacterium]
MSEALFEASGIVKHFGGVRAVENVSLQVPAGSIQAIIGPNGAGKSTLFNALSGFYYPDSGRVSFKGVDITRAPAYRRIAMGLGRTFQTSSIFPNLSVYDNLLVGVQSAENLAFRFRPVRANKRKEIDAKVERLLNFVNLMTSARRPVSELAHGSQRLCEIAMSLSTDPTLVMLDEPMAGLAHAETARIVEVIHKLHDELGLTVLFVEHNMRVVLSLAQRIMVLDRGKVLAEGTPAEISNNASVREAYIGKEVIENV